MSEFPEKLDVEPCPNCKAKGLPYKDYVIKGIFMCDSKMSEDDAREFVKRWKCYNKFKAACVIMLQEIEDNNYARYGIDPGMDDESEGAKLGRAALAEAETS